MKHLLLELHKYKVRQHAYIIVAFSAFPIVISILFILLRREQVAQLPLELIAQNNTGAWASLLYPLFAILLVQQLLEPEKQANIFTYYRSYIKNWYGIINRKCLLAFLYLGLLTLLNCIGHTILLTVASTVVAADTYALLVVDNALLFLKMWIALVPLLYVQLLINIVTKSAFVALAFGLLLLVVGIPLINLAQVFANPYTFSIAVTMPSVDYAVLFCSAVLAIAGSLFVSNWWLQR